MLVRAGDDEQAAQRLTRGWWDWPELVVALGERVEPLAGDVSRERLRLAAAAYESLTRRLTHVVHTAADLRIDAPVEELRRTNLEGTANVLELARAAAAHHRFERLLHVSTAYVAGLQSGEVAESSLDGEQGFANGYEQTKHEGERLVRAVAGELPVAVVRPGMIVGDSRTGEIDAIAHLTFAPAAAGNTFHLTAPREALPTVAELTELVREWARDHLGVRLPRPLFVRLARFAPRAVDRRLHPYVEGAPRFDRRKADRLLGPYQLDWREFLPRLLAYAVDAGFMHRSERTVFEQAFFRLGSRSRPVTLSDISERHMAFKSRWRREFRHPLRFFRNLDPHVHRCGCEPI